MSDVNYKTVIGLEVHVQLATETKLFCRCSTKFGAEPNTQTCPVCIGLPGALPVMNQHAYELALQTALALNCQIPRFTKWDRKQYYYPDLPKGYQISQYDLPMSANGWLQISDPKDLFPEKRVGITRAHLEEDAGKSMHDEQAGKLDSRIDLNRTGTPLLEIVSEPDMRSPAEAKAYLTELKLLLTYLGVSDCNMQEGSLRVDANVNLHVPQDGETIATPIVEVKNMNSFRAVERALAYEAERHYRHWQETGQKLGDVPKQTRGWDEASQSTKPQRSKEESSDYRYFPDPDLVPVVVSEEQIERQREAMGELPASIRNRLQSELGIPAYDADVLVNQGRELVQYYLDVARIGGDPKKASNWVQQDVLRYLNDRGVGIDRFPVSAEQLGRLIAEIDSGQIPNSRAPDVLNWMLESGGDVRQATSALCIEQLDTDQLEMLCRRLLDANPKIVQDVRGGKQQAVGALIGQAKRENPNVDPGAVRKICLKIIGQSQN